MDYRQKAEELVVSLANMRKRIALGSLERMISGEKIVLCILAKESVLQTPGKLCREMMISSARVAAILKSLESKGFINRTQKSSDKRSYEIALTSKGRNEILLEHHSMITSISKTLYALGTEDTEELIRIMNKLACIKEKGKIDA